jgi:beta-lactamase regulating signal transducer with metallopeptidase domain
MMVIVVMAKTSIILALGMLAARLFRRRSAAVRHWIVASAMICAAAVPVIGRAAPSWTGPVLLSSDAARGTAVDVSFTPVTAAGSTASTMSTPPWQPAGDAIRGFVVPVWSIGVAINLGMLLIGVVRVRRMLTSCTVNADASLRESLRCVSAMFPLRRHVALVCSTQAVPIITWGVFRPQILLPPEASAWRRERLDMVLAHEIAHVARGDWLVQMVAEVCKAFYWFNPLFWAACARLRYESERACDDAVMHTGVASHEYATELLHLARSARRHGLPRLPAPAMAARPSNLERRVRAMLNSGIDRSPLTRRIQWGSAVALLAITVPVATFAQGGFATLSGTVVDPQDRALPAATVTVTDARRDVKHETRTDSNGHFELVGLPAGDYSLEAKRPGFQTLTDTFAINGASLERMLTLPVGELQETIVVVSEDGSVTSARQTGRVAAKRPVDACTPTSGAGGTIRPPHKVKDVRPGYPGVDGRVELAATIGTDGSVADVQVVRADRPELAAPAIDAVRQWEFDSTLLNCLPIEVRMNVSVTFREGN